MILYLATYEADQYFDQSFYKGKQSLNRIIDIYREGLPGSAVRYAQALVYQGDFYLALSRKWNAMNNYKKAYSVLIEHSVNVKEVKVIFGEPRRLTPFNIPHKESQVLAEARYVEASFNVPKDGWPRDIKIVGTNPEDSHELRTQGRHAIASTRYRPRFEHGKPVTTERVSMRYVFRD